MTDTPIISQTHVLDEAGRCTGWYAGYTTAIRDEQKKQSPGSVPPEVMGYIHRQIGLAVLRSIATGRKTWQEEADPYLVAASLVMAVDQ